MYLDSAYIAKYYVSEPDSGAVRAEIQRASKLESSSWATVEVAGVFHRHVREGYLSTAQCSKLLSLFLMHIREGTWQLAPLGESLLREAVQLQEKLPSNVPLRAGDAVHLATALRHGYKEIWASDRHLLQAAGHVGLTGRTASTNHA